MSENEVYISPEGYKKLEQELEHLTKHRRKEVAMRIKEALEFGDISENSEYDDAKNEQAFVEGRILYISELLAKARVESGKGRKTDQVRLNLFVKIKNKKTKELEEYQIVGSVEADPIEDKISNESPVGAALMGKHVGDIVEVTTPEGAVSYEIIKIFKN